MPKLSDAPLYNPTALEAGTVRIHRLGSETRDVAVIREATAACVRPSELRDDSRIILKPNLCCPIPKLGVTTSARWLRTVVSALRIYTEHITIVESDGMRQAWSAEEAFKNHGVYDLCQQYGIRAVNLTQERTRTVSTVVNDRDITLTLPSLLFETDLFVSVPVAKVHSMTTVSLGLKNQWGCIPSPYRFRYHSRFSETVVAVNKLLRPRLSFIDGGYFLDRRGPLHGRPIRMGVGISGELGAAEVVTCNLMGFDPALIPYLNLAQAHRLLPTSAPKILDHDYQEGYKCSLRRTATDWLRLGVFRSRTASRLLNDSFLAGPLHHAYYIMSGGREYTPNWKSR
jgi:uncharacterized protein (DUF362 family)